MSGLWIPASLHIRHSPNLLLNLVNMSSAGGRQQRVGISIYLADEASLFSSEGQTTRAMAFEAQFAEIEDKSCHLLSCDWVRLRLGFPARFCSCIPRRVEHNAYKMPCRPFNVGVMDLNTSNDSDVLHKQRAQVLVLPQLRLLLGPFLHIV